MRNLTVYCKDEESASLKWLAPYPPNGKLEKYIFEISDDFDKTAPVPCDLWPEFHCKTITGLKPTKFYDVKVIAVYR